MSYVIKRSDGYYYAEWGWAVDQSDATRFDEKIDAMSTLWAERFNHRDDFRDISLVKLTPKKNDGPLTDTERFQFVDAFFTTRAVRNALKFHLEDSHMDLLARVDDLNDDLDFADD